MDIVPEITIDELEVALADGAYLLDVRELDEIAMAAVAGGVRLPLATIPDNLDQIPTDRPVYVICASGNRSMHAGQFLRENGIDAINVAGGTKAWVAAGKPFESTQ